MLRIAMLINGLEEFVRFSSVKSEWIDNIQGILMLEDNMPIHDNHVYLASPEIAIRFIEAYKGTTSFTLFIAGNPKLTEAQSPKLLNIICIDVEWARLYNEIYRNYTLFCSWDKALSKVTVESLSIKMLLQTAVNLSDHKVSFYMLSPTFKLIDSCSSENQLSKISNKINNGAFLSESFIAECMNQIICEDPANNPEDKSKLSYQLYPVKRGDVSIGYLMAIGLTAFNGYPELIKLLQREIARHLGNGLLTTGSHYEITKIFEEIFLFLPEDTDGLWAKLNTLPHPLRRYIRIVLVDFDAEISPSTIISELQNIFPNANIAPYASHIVAFVSGDNHLFIPEFNEEKLEALLKKYSGYAIIGNAGRFLRGIRTLYIQCAETLPLLRKLCKEKRWAYFEKMMEYHIIALCASVISEHYGHDRLVYLAHPAVMELMRHDAKHGSDLRDFLFSYIENDCSIINTAQKLHMHRNTVIYKLKKIEDILGLDLHDFALCRELMFSCQVMIYTERIQGKSFYINDDYTDRNKKLEINKRLS